LLLVLVPTYNESGNVERLCRDVLALGLDLEMLFVDDNSTDGTGAILDRLVAENPAVHVLHRSGKLGVGSAHVAGIRWAYDHGCDRLVTMDCDFTHDPRNIPALLAAAEQGADIVVGSRYLQKSSLADWNIYRKTLTHIGHFLTRTLLGMPYDATNAFRCYRLDTVPRRAFDVVVSGGYSFFFESLYVLHRNGFRIAQIPVPLPKRTYGSSKMGIGEISASVRLLVTTCFKAMFNPEKFDIGLDDAAFPTDAGLADDQGWDAYWDGQKTHTGGLLYDAVASFYRKWIIRPTLNHFVKRHLPPGAVVLHAGCGSGQVDADIRHHVAITGMDISVNALRLYRKVNRGHCQTLHGSIFAIPLPDESVQGVYNLGVMEHFTEEDIARILGEFHRVLKRDGRVIVLWPPEFGLSVLFFKALGWVFRNVLGKKDVKFHPDEITRVRSRRHVTGIFERAGFRVLEYSFGPRDAFTYVIVAAERADRPAA
jgi:dolichol-phosphate mannosyltransferase